MYGDTISSNRSSIWSNLFFVTGHAKFRIGQGYTQQAWITPTVMNIMTGSTFDPDRTTATRPEKDQFPLRTKVAVKAELPGGLYRLMLPFDTNRMIIRQIRTQIFACDHFRKTTLATKTIDGNGTIMTGEAKFGWAPWLGWVYLQAITGI